MAETSLAKEKENKNFNNNNIICPLVQHYIYFIYII